jgi:hypothetical protein
VSESEEKLKAKKEPLLSAPFSFILRPFFKLRNRMLLRERVNSAIEQSDYISRDLSWLKFNWRVLDQAKNPTAAFLNALSSWPSRPPTSTSFS